MSDEILYKIWSCRKNTYRQWSELYFKRVHGICKNMVYKKSTSTSYHAQTQRLCEKWNGTIVQILKRYVNDTAETWDENLDMATYAYNTAIQRTNGMTPYEVMFGRKANTSISFLQSRKNLSESDYLMKLQRDISNNK